MTKKQILILLEKYKGEILSGEEIALSLGMSRTAIWKAINVLRNEGYDIESIRKKGYRLNPNSDILSTVKIGEHLVEGMCIPEIEIHKSIDSTNKRLKYLALEDAPHWKVVASEEQFAGRGRGQKSFLSPEGKGVYMSILLRPQIKWEERQQLLMCVNEAIKNVLEKTAHIPVTYSESGDFYIQNKKVGGVLTEISVEAESEMIESMVIGIGINIYDKRKNNKVDDIQVALSEVTGSYCNRSELIASVISEVYQKINN